MKNYAIILAGGSGNRMKMETPKAFIKIKEKFLIEYCIQAFSENKQIDHIILVVPGEYIKPTEEAIKTKYTKVISVQQGGASRYESSKIGVGQVNEEQAKILIHDAARPFVTQNIINDSVSALDHFDAINPLAPISDTLVRLENNQVAGNLDRNKIRQAQTPQSFKLKTISIAHKKAEQENEEITDDYNLVLKYKCGSASWIEGSKLNFKVTYPDDLELATRLTQEQH